MTTTIQQHAKTCATCMTGALCKTGAEILLSEDAGAPAKRTTKRTFITRIAGRACENFGAVSYTITETLTVRGAGLQLDIRVRGTCEGESIDQTSTRMIKGVTMERAVAYRLANGYAEVQS